MSLPAHDSHRMKWLLAIGVSAAVFSAAPAYADPSHDPYHPNYDGNWCPGGGTGAAGARGYCDGVDYPDGSFWHAAGFTGPEHFEETVRCKLHSGLILQDAPPGGCGNEWHR